MKLIWGEEINLCINIFIFRGIFGKILWEIDIDCVQVEIDQRSVSDYSSAIGLFF